MVYQVLARKSRPQDFSSVVGQSSVVTALRNALVEDRVAQAYLFAGIRGVGKTSVARVFAKALNCERGPGADPCNECTTCIEITRGADLDVVEVDAATYSKVEQVRELTESLQYGPTRDRYKVVVIDEIHRLSRQAFDALLKIVEEPPERIVFIFATTEIDAVPATILSRCQEFHFRRVSFTELSAHLRRLAGSESITVSDPALRLIARAAEGSVRDAVALLDQLSTFGGGKIEDIDAARLAGGLDADYYQTVLAAILDGDGAAVCSAIARIEEEGWDPRTAYNQLLSFLRDALHLALGAEVPEIDLPEEQASALNELAQAAGSENLLRILHLLLGSEMTVRRSESGALAAEVAWLRAAELPKLTRIEDILSGGEPGPGRAGAAGGRRAGGGSSGPTTTADKREKRGGGAPPAAAKTRPSPAQAAPSPTTAPPPRPPVAVADAPRQKARAGKSGPHEAANGPPEKAHADQAPTEEPSRPVESAADGDPRKTPKGGARGETARLLEEVGRRKQFLAAHLAEAESLEVRDGRLEIAVPKDDTWLSDSLQRKANRKALEDSIAAVWGDGFSWSLISTETRSNVGSTGFDNSPQDDILNDPEVQTVLELFGGTVETTEAVREDDKA